MPLTDKQKEAWDHLVELCEDRAPLIETTEAMRSVVIEIDRTLSKLGTAVRPSAAELAALLGVTVYGNV